MSKKEIAIAFLKMAGTGQVQEAYDKFISKNFIHHNQYFKGDRQSLLNAMADAHMASPNKSIEIQNACEEGNTVMTFSKVVRVKPEDADVAVVHIFRFDGDKVVELWDVGQLAEKNSPNENGLF
jgi:predicted SnoaL-like aldol condensation-catalyzing enzyme